MNLHIIKIKDSLNKAYLKLPPTRSQIETFKENISYLFKHVKDSEGEEFHKNEISEFLKKTYYSPNHYINTRGRYDLVIHNGKDSNSSVGVIVEAKSPGNVSDMPTINNLNALATQELILYYLRERITNKNLELKHLIVTNLFEWFIFDAHEFEKHFANNKSFVQKFIDFEEGRTSGKDTSFFYNSVAAAFLDTLDSEIKFTHLDLRDFEYIVINSNKEDDNRLSPLYKIFSPEHLLKLQFKNDSNSLDKDFYHELLHIIGLEETKQGNKKLIGRAGEKTRNYGSLLEAAISNLKAEDLISQVPRPTDFGNTQDEQLFNISLELVITWINRILFLKLLEGQLNKYNRGDNNFKFLNQTIISDYDALNRLFFYILAIPESDREERLKEKFKNIPYLNSSLFEPTDIERRTIRISNLDNANKLPVHKSTVLKDSLGKRISGEEYTLAYLFEFLDAYNFSSEGEKGIQEENKTLINASVLGLIFEKINGYKDGSYFTPGFITQYMCHETITRAVVQKFNEIKSWHCETITDVNNKIEDKQEANRLINSLRICDPAVGSGHFLVSALNEILSIKSELKILMDRQGRVLREYHFEVINDELIVSDPDGEPFEYNPKNQENQRVQEAIFHEKQTIIENCLFGVDINPNSVKICRLRLWIELLKNAYYKPNSNYTELETLPNIDINIKCGNSLISRYPLDADIKISLKSSKWTVDSYCEAVMNYRNAVSKEEKRTLENLIYKIKSDFATEVSRTNQDVKTLNKYKNELLQLTSIQLFNYDNDHQKRAWCKRLDILNSNIDKLELKISEIKNNKVFENAFEWRFEFPEVLNNDGDFVGFDVIIGNPPYIQQRKLKGTTVLFSKWYSVYSGTADLSVFFFERGINLLKSKGQFAFITTNKFFNTEYGKPLRKYLCSFRVNEIVNFELVPIFDEALVSSVIIMIDNDKPSQSFNFLEFNNEDINQEKFRKGQKSLITRLDSKLLSNDFWLFTKIKKQEILAKLKKQGNELKFDDSIQIRRGITTGFDDAFVVDKNSSVYNSSIAKKFLRGKDIHRYEISENNLRLLFIPWHFPLNNNDSIIGASEVAEKSFNKIYPNEYNHLLTFKSELSNRNKSETGIRYEWYSLQRCASSYYELFDKDKIVWGIISGGWDFAFDNKQNLLTSSSFFLTSEKVPLKYILALFNSKLYQFYFSLIGEKTAGGAFVFKKTTIEKFLIPTDDKYLNDIIERVDEIQNNKERSSIEIEVEIDQLVYRLFCLTEEEIEIIENA